MLLHEPRGVCPLGPEDHTAVGESPIERIQNCGIFSAEKEELSTMAVVASISQQIWDMKYRLKGPSGEPADKTIEDTWRRVAMALAAP